MSPLDAATPYQRLLARYVAEYQALRNPAATQTFETLLNRYAAVWNAESAFAEPGTEPPASSVAPLETNPGNTATGCIGYHSFTKPAGHGPWVHIRRLAALPVLARLNHVRQLSTTSMGLNIEATHNRLAHLLGTHDICAAMLQEACFTAPQEYLPTHDEATATLLLALLHDIYHGPFGHSLDRLGSLVFTDESRIDKGLLTEQANEAQQHRGPLWELIQLAAKWISVDEQDWRLRTAGSKRIPGRAADSAERIADFFGALVLRKEALAQSHPTKYWLRELVDGPLDADRLDYLLRDTHALYWRSSVSVDQLGQLIRGLRLGPGHVGVLAENPSTRQYEDQLIEVARVKWDSSQAAVVGDFLSLRADLYRDVYESPQKRGFDEMLAHALVWVLRAAVGDSIEELGKVLRRVAAVTDDELFHCFYEAIGPAQLLEQAIVHDLALGRPFTPVWELDLATEELEDAQKRQEMLASLWQKEETDLRQRRVVAPLPDTTILLAQLRRHVDLSSDETVLAIAYFIEQLLGRNFVAREALERLFWSEFLRGGGDKTTEQVIQDELVATFVRISAPEQDNADARKRFVERTKTHPLAFISIPWAPRPRDVAAMGNWEPQDDVVFHDHGKVSDVQPAISKRNQQRFYPITVYLPQNLARHEAIVDCVDRLMYSLFKSLVWYRPYDIAKNNDWVSKDVPDDWRGKFILRSSF